MPTIPEKIERANAIFLYSLDAGKLTEGCQELDRLLKQDRPNEHNRENAEALSFRMRAKALALRFYDAFVPVEGDELVRYLEETEPVARSKGYTKTASALERLLAFTMRAREITDGVYALLYKLRGESGWLVKTAKEAAEAADQLERALTQAGELEGGSPFGANVKFYDLKERVISAVTEEREEVLAVRFRLEEAEEARLLEDAAKPLAPKGEYFPVWNDEREANAVVLCTPLLEEARLAAAHYAQKREKSCCELNAAALSGKTATQLSALFAALKKRGCDCLLTGFSGLRGGRKEILSAAVSFGREGGHVFLWDETGKRALYDEAVAAGGVSGTGYYYLTMPYFRDVVDLFEEKGMISGTGEYAFLRETLPFMGYTGLNAASAAFASGKDWKKVAAAHSKNNRQKALVYLAELPSQNQLLDEDWGKFGEGAVDRNARSKFDYDDIKGLNPRNIEKIMASGGNFFSICGMVARYCVLCGDDISVWNTLDRETKSERLTVATKLVQRLLDTGIDPQVELVPEEEWERKDAGGLCCEGGNRILYREKCSVDCEWMIMCILHECFHAFQHTAINRGFRDWYWEELGVTKGRLDEWRYNFDHYEGKTSSITYKVEIVECDARAFEHDCFTMSEDVWHRIDFE